MASSEIDKESEALVRQLHRELNGLTRASRRTQQPPSHAATASARRELHRKLLDRRGGSREPSDRSKRCTSHELSHSGTGEAPSSRSESHQEDSQSRSASPPARKRARKQRSEGMPPPPRAVPHACLMPCQAHLALHACVRVAPADGAHGAVTT